MDIADAMIQMYEDENLRNTCKRRGIYKGKEWVNGASNICGLLDEVCDSAIKNIKISQEKTKINEVLFVQHSSAGDVLMTTQCFKGIKEKHPGLKLNYMTQKGYHDILKGNLYIDNVLDWDPKIIDKYDIVYNPHGEKILPGGWNNLDIKLHYMYPYFCKVQPDLVNIKVINPNIDIPNEYIVLHTTGASEYREYKYMHKVIKGMNYNFIQIGGEYDKRVGVIDLCGKLTFNQTAFILQKAKACVCIDSFPAHLAGALGVPSVVLFGPAPARVTGPRFQKDENRVYKDTYLIELQPSMLDVCSVLSHCWGTPKQTNNKCLTPCINTISPKTIRKSLESIL
jgi:hypothetical protein